MTSREKKTAAMAVFERASRGRPGGLQHPGACKSSTCNATRRLASPLHPERAAARVRDFARLPLVRVHEVMILAAIERSRSMSFSFWDALILEAALSAGADRLLTEDLQHGQRIEGLTVVNPFVGTEQG